MIIEQIYTGCLAQGAYYIESAGEAAIIDPLREVDPYIERANRDGAKIKYIFETHFHADFVSGHVTLSEKTGATIVYGPTAETTFESKVASDGEIFHVGKVSIKVLHTPGHTIESSCYLLMDEKGRNHALFSGDTLFLGDVGRPDLAQKAAHMTQEELAGQLYDSLRKKIMPLEDSITVYPAHGAGSACGKNMMKETIDTLGNQKRINYALREDMTREEFISEVTEGLLPPPAYFPLNVKLNRTGYAPVGQILKTGNNGLSPKSFELLANETDAVILDVRHHRTYIQGHIPRSISIGLNGSFAPWVGALIKDVQTPILLVAEEDEVEEAILRLSRVGFDNTLGYLKGGVGAWKSAGKELDKLESISSKELFDRYMKNNAIPIFDVRKPSEFEAEHVTHARTTPLDFIDQHIAEFPKENTFYVHCRSGYRSVIAASILKMHGYHNVIDVAGGFLAMKDESMPTSDFSCKQLN